MATVSAPYGLKPAELSGGSPKGIINSYTLTTNTATGFFQGDIVNMGAGVLTPITATPTTARNGNSPWGIFWGCSYYGTGGQPVIANTFPAAGYTAYAANGPIVLFIIDDPYIEMQIQASATVAATALGKKAALTNFSAGVVASGQSRVQLDASTINTTNTLAVTIKRFAPASTSTAGIATGVYSDTYTDLIVVWNQNVHAMNNILGV